eukprot:Opistho-2@24328
MDSRGDDGDNRPGSGHRASSVPELPDIGTNGSNNSRRPSSGTSRGDGEDRVEPLPPPRGKTAGADYAQMIINNARLPVKQLRKGSVAMDDTSLLTPSIWKSFGSSSGVARLMYRTSYGLETEFPLVEEHVTIGRKSCNTIRLNDIQISKEHCVIERRQDGYAIRDLGSSNGVIVNRRKVKEKVLADRDEIELGRVRLVFTVASPAGAGPFDGHPLGFAARYRAGSMSTTGTLPSGADGAAAAADGGDAGGGASSEKDRQLRNYVTIVPDKHDFDQKVVVHEAIEDAALRKEFLPSSEVTDIEILRQDYEKLRVCHEISRIGPQDLNAMLEKMIDLLFSILPADHGVVMLKDEETGTFDIMKVKVRNGTKHVGEIKLSATILNHVTHYRTSLIASDAFYDPRFSGSNSIVRESIRAVLVVPLITHDDVIGVLQLDSRERVGAFSEKDLHLVKAVANQAAVAIQNSMLLRRVEAEAKTREQLDRFLPPQVVERVLRGKGEIKRGGRELVGTVVFADIRGFTRMSEKASGPQEIVDILNDYFERLVSIVFRRQGILDKYIGDALMAVFGTLDSEIDPVYNSVAAAIEFRDAIRVMNAERAQLNLDPIGIGVGVNTGSLVAGFVGCHQRLEYTCIGDTVNTSSRICDMAAADQVLVSKSTCDIVKDRIELKYVASRKFKGKAIEIDIYEPLRLLDVPDAKAIPATASGSSSPSKAR